MHLIEIAMAFSQTLCTILNPTPYSYKNSSKPFFAKPSYFFTHAKRSITFQIPCKGGENQAEETSLGYKVDRRNVLFGGLYGAANLVSDHPLASADPLKAPEFNKCGVAKDLNKGGAALDVNCCPPLSDIIIDYKLPHVTKLRVRPAAHKANKEYIAKYKKAIELMKALPPEDPRSFTQQANIHCAYCNGAHDQAGHTGLDIQVHNSWLFFPFHRWYLYFFERILGNLIGDPNFALPSWNWDNHKGMNVPSMFTDSTSPLYNSKRNSANMPPTVIDLGLTGGGATDNLQKVVNNLTIMYSEMVRSVNTVEDFMGKPYLDGSATDPGPGSSERGSHVAAHVFVGDPKQPSFEDMGNFYSAGRDPLFYCHHANVDRMWTLWRELKTPIPKDITDADFLNAEFLFYDENAQLVRVRVGDSVNNAKMGYTYEKMDLPWLNYKPPKKATKSRVKNLSTAPNAAHVLPVTLNNIVRVEVPKSSKGKADELLVLEDIEVDTSRFIKFDVFINDEDDESNELDKAEYAGTFAQVPHKTKNSKGKSSINLKLTQLYDDIDVADDNTIVVTILPRSNGEDVTIGGIKIIPAPITASS